MNTVTDRVNDHLARQSGAIGLRPYRRLLNSRRGFTVVEMLVAGLVMAAFGAALWTLIRSSYDSQYLLMNQNTANMEARQVVDTFADKLRGAASLTTAAGSDITFTDSAGTTYRYWKSENTLNYSVNGSPAGGTQILQDLTSLTLTYWSWNGTAWSTSTAPSNLTTVAGVDIAANCTKNGSLRQVTSSVRLRQIMRF